MNLNTFSSLPRQLGAILSFGAFAALAGCGGGGAGTSVPTSQPTAQPTSTPTPIPSAQPLRPGGSGDGYVLSSKTYLLTSSSPVQIVSQNATSLTLSKAVTLPAGSILISDIGNGTLVKVASAQVVGTTTVIQTQDAALSEAFTQLTLPAKMPWNESVAGPITPRVAGVTATWNNDAINFDFGSTTGTASTRVRAATVINGVGVSGSVSFKANPVLNPVVVPGTDGEGVLKSLEIGFKPEFAGSLQLQRKVSGALSLNQTIVDQMLPAFRVGGIIKVRPHLIVTASLSGKASYAFGAGVKCDASATALLTFDGNGITPVLQGASNTTPDITLAKGAFNYDARVLNATVTLEVLGIGGPSIGAFVGSQGKGVLEVKDDGRNVISAEAGAGLYMEVGLKGSTKLKKFFEEFFPSAQLPNVSKSFQLLGPKRKWEFPVQSSAVLVGDNGPQADDVFEVAVDRDVLGATQKGQDGRFPINDLSPGDHTLTVKCLDDGYAGADAGTLGISLSEGLTFKDGSTTYSEDLSLGSSVTLTFVVPNVTTDSITIAPIRRMTTGRRGR